jgi:hypothetical protein
VLLVLTFSYLWLSNCSFSPCFPFFSDLVGCPISFILFAVLPSTFLFIVSFLLPFRMSTKFPPESRWTLIHPCCYNASHLLTYRLTIHFFRFPPPFLSLFSSHLPTISSHTFRVISHFLFLSLPSSLTLLTPSISSVPLLADVQLPCWLSSQLSPKEQVGFSSFSPSPSPSSSSSSWSDTIVFLFFFQPTWDDFLDLTLPG